MLCIFYVNFFSFFVSCFFYFFLFLFSFQQYFANFITYLLQNTIYDSVMIPIVSSFEHTYFLFWKCWWVWKEKLLFIYRQINKYIYLFYRITPKYVGIYVCLPCSPCKRWSCVVGLFDRYYILYIYIYI